MGLFDKRKKDEITDEIIINDAGQEMHILNGDNGPMVIKKLDHSVWQATGEEWCPDCHIKMTHKDGYWECRDCKGSITDEESELGDGYSTEESTYENDYEEYFGSDEDDD